MPAIVARSALLPCVVAMSCSPSGDAALL